MGCIVPFHHYLRQLSSPVPDQKRFRAGRFAVVVEMDPMPCQASDPLGCKRCGVYDRAQVVAVFDVTFVVRPNVLPNAAVDYHYHSTNYCHAYRNENRLDLMVDGHMRPEYEFYHFAVKRNIIKNYYK